MIDESQIFMTQKKFQIYNKNTKSPVTNSRKRRLPQVKQTRGKIVTLASDERHNGAALAHSYLPAKAATVCFCLNSHIKCAHSFFAGILRLGPIPLHIKTFVQ